MSNEAIFQLHVCCFLVYLCIRFKLNLHVDWMYRLGLSIVDI